MNPSAWAVGVALVAGSLRAVQLWRAGTRVEVVNSVVLAALGEGRGASALGALHKAGGALYLDVARRVATPLDKLRQGTDEELKLTLERDAQRALLDGTRRLQRFAWLDYTALLGILFTGIAALTGAASTVLALELVAATLLWLSNLYGARSIATRMFAGATALVDALIAGREHFQWEEERSCVAEEDT